MPYLTIPILVYPTVLGISALNYLRCPSVHHRKFPMPPGQPDSQGQEKCFRLFCVLPRLSTSAVHRNWLEDRQEIQARFYWGLCCTSGEWEQGTRSLACLFPEWVQAGFLYRVRLSVGPGLRPKGWSRCFAQPLVVLSTGLMCSILLLLPALQKWQLSFFGLLVSYPEFAPTAHVHSYFRSLIVPLYFVAQGDIFPNANLETLQQSVLGSCLSRAVHSHGQYLGGLDSTDRVRMCPVPFPVLIFLPAQGWPLSWICLKLSYFSLYLNYVSIPKW